MTLRVLCPAKLNLFLSVGPKDASGYHPIRTIFQAVDLFDEMLISTATQSSITSNIVLPQDNTVSRAIRLMREAAVVPCLQIHLEKRIPTGAGLGGGSSDAAGAILAINRLLPKSLPGDTLSDIARAVGADVPFFLRGGRARAAGYGELLTSEETPPGQWFAIAKPEIGVSTSEAYAKLDELSFPFAELPDADQLHNDFERVAPTESREAARRIKLLLGEGGLTGSGSAVFGRASSEEAARDAVDELERMGYSAWAVKAIDSGPIVELRD